MAADHRTESFRREFAARLVYALTSLGYEPGRPKELGRLFGVSGQAVRKWLEGAALPNTTRMVVVAEALGVRRAWLQDGEPPMRPQVAEISDAVYDLSDGGEADGAAAGTPRGTLRIGDDEVRLLSAYRLLADTDRQAVRTLVFSLAGKKDAR